MYRNTTIPADTVDSTITTDPTRRYRCRHVFTDGHRCGSPSLRGQDLCYYHHVSRHEPRLAPGCGVFTMPRIDDRDAIQLALHDILARISLRDIDLKSASMLLYGLQIASSNLTQREKSARSAQSANSEPLVEDVVSNPFLGDLAPIAEMPDLEARKSTQDATPAETPVILSEARSAESEDPTQHMPTQPPAPFHPNPSLSSPPTQAQPNPRHPVPQTLLQTRSNRTPASSTRCAGDDAHDNGAAHPSENDGAGAAFGGIR